MIHSLVLAALVAASPAPSASPTPVPDPCGSLSSIVTRPTFTTSVCTVQPHGILLESGYANTVTTGNGPSNAASYPQAFLRIGTGDPHLEWNVSPYTFDRTNASGVVSSGYGDVFAGIKAELGYTAKAVWGVNASLSLPTGSAGYTAGGPGYTANFNWTYTLNDTFSLAGTAGFNDLAGYDALGTPGRYFTFDPTLALFVSLPNQTELFAEGAYFTSAGPGLGAKSTFDVGYERDLSNNVQFDVEYGFTPTPVNGQRSSYVGTGLSFLFGVP
jgi:opacity protein-like surface antigen